MTTDEYLGGLTTSTAKEYRTTLRYLKEWQEKAKTIPFADFLKQQNIAQNTIAKHNNQARVVIKKCDFDYNVPIMVRDQKEYPSRPRKSHLSL